MVGTCRYTSCQNALGSEYRYVTKGQRRKTILCRQHEDMVDEALNRGEKVIVSPEGWVYLDVTPAFSK